MTKLWQKNKTKLHPLIEAYTVGDDYLIDIQLIPYDIAGTKAHARGLAKIGILTKAELKQIESALAGLLAEWKKGETKIAPSDEDCHTLIENHLTEKLGKTGQKIHTGRSRNDQILTVLRLFMKDELEEIKKLAVKTAEKFLFLAEKYKSIPMPGYSHFKQAMLSSVGHYFAGLAESLLDDTEFLNAVHRHIDKNPLGSAAGFGVSLPLDREFTAKELNFSQVQINSLYCQNSRGKFESIYLEGLSQIMLTLGRFASDMLIFTADEFNYFSVDEKLTTGSSIMPHKKNLDALEIMLGQASVVFANQQLIKNLALPPLSGYSRQFQLMKKPLMESVKIVIDSLEAINVFLSGIKPNQKEIEKKISKKIFSADIANELAQKENIPFREACQKALSKLVDYQINLKANLKSKKSLGAPGNLALAGYRERIKFLKTNPA